MARLPTDTERIFIAGRTGWGKTTEACHHLSQRSIDTKPWVIVDFKGDDVVAALPVTALGTVHDKPPTDPGLYVYKATWEDAEPRGRLDSFLFECLEQRRIGVFIDEGQMIGQRNRGLRAILTQGRSAEVPLIFCTQRPVHVDTFALSESEILQFFRLQHPDDYERVRAYVDESRVDFDWLRTAGKYHSIVYDIATDEVDFLGPCPPFAEIYDRILTRLPVYEDERGPLPERRARV